MSINRNRAKLKVANCSNDYKIIWLKYVYPMYWDEGIYFKNGNYSYQWRMYRTWKYNRKTQWKN